MFVIRAKRGKERKIKNLYPNLFSDEIADIIGEGDTGLANLFSAEDEYIGTGLFSRKSNKVFRLLSTQPIEITTAYFAGVFKRALKRRSHLFHEGCFRLINAESDFLPGVIIDKYDRVFVLQIRHPVWVDFKPLMVDALYEAFDDVQGVYERSDFESSIDDSLERHSGLLCGEVSQEQIITENGIRYRISIPKGQKTGFFMDQRDNRQIAGQLAQRYSLQGSKGLDLFSFTGSFSFSMAQAGLQTLGVDKSAEDIESAKENAKLNQLDQQCRFICHDVFEFSGLKPEYKMIILDPPSLVKEKQDKHFGKRKFTELVKKGLQFLDTPGIMGLCSCAYHIGIDELEEALRRGCESYGYYGFIVDIGFQASDHPWMVQIPESLYLKCLWVYIDSV
ncbi:MAG TPA: class I SAM-dependent rRNA methyltransferase [Thermotogota bacterium]|nr:class I SAM-dependent rRNA methyltransferase [Thermotogota bacterium]